MGSRSDEMKSSIETHMEKVARFGLVGKSVRVHNVNKWIDDTNGVVQHETDKGIWIEDTVWNETVFIPWSSIARLRLDD